MEFKRSNYKIEKTKRIKRNWFLNMLGFKPIFEKTITNISLITPEEFLTLPYRTKLYSIHNYAYVKGCEIIDQETRNGFIAFGFKES